MFYLGVEYLIALHSIYSLLGQKITKLMNYFGDAEECWRNEDLWSQILKISKHSFENLLSEKHGIDVHRTYETFLKSGAKYVTLDDFDYPQRLKNIYSPPYLLYYKGTLPDENVINIAMIGSRRASPYGLQATEYISKQLAECGVTIVSGLARGIDSAGHRGALTVGGKNIGVLGSGVDVIYPPENKKLFEEVIENGCIISEFPLGTKPLPRNFVARNRLVSGLSDGVVVVEATKKSGTQITVDFALEQGKSLFAVPGPIFSPLSQGTHKLIRDDNVKLVTCADDIMSEFKDWQFLKNKVQENNDSVQFCNDLAIDLSEFEKQIWDYLVISRHFNEIAEEFQKDAADLASVLTVMEIRGYISRTDGQYYIRNN